MRRTRAAVLVALVAICLSSCLGRSTRIESSDFDRSCKQDSDCMVVHLGDQCDCFPDRVAINAADYARYKEAADDVECEWIGTCGMGGPMPPAVCERGHCIAKP